MLKGRFRADFSWWGTGKVGERGLRPGKRWFAEISNFIVVRLKTPHRFHFLLFSLPFTFNICCGLGILEVRASGCKDLVAETAIQRESRWLAVLGEVIDSELFEPRRAKKPNCTFFFHQLEKERAIPGNLEVIGRHY